MSNFEYIVCIYREIFREETDCSEMYIRGVLDALNTLTEREQATLEMYHRHGLTYRQVGEKMGFSGSCAGTVMTKAIRKLRHPSRCKNMQVAKIIEKYKTELGHKTDTINELYGEIENLLQGKPISDKLKSALGRRKLQIGQLGLRTRTYALLLGAGFFTVDSLLALNSLDVLMKIRRFGKFAKEDILSRMREHGYGEWADSLENTGG